MAAVTGLRLLILRVRDADRCVPFYRDGLGLPISVAVDGRLTQFALPGGIHIDLEHRPMVTPREAPADRTESPESIVLYVDDVAAIVERCRPFGSVVNEPYRFNGRMLAYVADPEGHVIGLTTN